MKANLLKTITLPAVLLLASSSAWALEYGQNVSPSVFYGSGNGNGSFTVDREGDIELGLRTHQRVPPANVFNNTSLNNYAWTDTTANVGKAAWNYDWSANVNTGGTGGSLADYTFKLFVDSDAGLGQTWSSYDAFFAGNDNDILGDAAQNSQNPRFAGVGIANYDSTAAGTYDIRLVAFDKSSGDIAAQTIIRVNVNGGAAGAGNYGVPDTASTMMLLGAGMTGLAAFRRRFSK